MIMTLTQVYLYSSSSTSSQYSDWEAGSALAPPARARRRPVRYSPQSREPRARAEPPRAEPPEPAEPADPPDR